MDSGERPTDEMDGIVKQLEASPCPPIGVDADGTETWTLTPGWAQVRQLAMGDAASNMILGAEESAAGHEGPLLAGLVAGDCGSVNGSGHGSRATMSSPPTSKGSRGCSRSLEREDRAKAATPLQLRPHVT